VLEGTLYSQQLNTPGQDYASNAFLFPNNMGSYYLKIMFVYVYDGGKGKGNWHYLLDFRPALPYRLIFEKLWGHLFNICKWVLTGT
jgi:hypothetical protein